MSEQPSRSDATHGFQVLDFILGKEIASYVRLHKRLVVISMVLSAISAFFAVMPAVLIGPFIDECMKKGTEPASWKIPWLAIDPHSWLSWHRTEWVLVDKISQNELLVILLVVSLVSVFGKSITTYISSYAAAAFSNRATRSLRIDLFRKFVSLSLSYYHKRKSGELVSRAASDVTAMQNNIPNILMGYVENPLAAVVTLGYLLVMNYKLTLIVFISAPVIVGLVRLFGRKVKKNAVRMQDATAKVTSTYHETIQCLKVIQCFVRSDYEEEKFKKHTYEQYKRIMHWRRWDLAVNPVMDLTVFLGAPLVLIAARFYFNHSLGEIMSMFFAFSKLYTPVKKIVKINNELRTLQGITKRVFGILSTSPEIKDSHQARILPRHNKSIEFKNVDFSYSPEEPVLKGVSFVVKAGEMVAFVGSTGAGKSTLLDLIPRFYDVTNGAITIDGTDIRDVTLESLRGQIGIVSQDVVLFHDTIFNNIAYGRSGSTVKEVESAAKAAHAHEFIIAQPKGYESIVGDRGTRLSGGQRQRIAIARAILSSPAILMLDEAASALDAESEEYIKKAIEKLQGTQTILVVAHRLSTIMRADHVYVLEDGKIIESGTLEELIAFGGRFRQLYDMQFKTNSMS
ncbi:putative Lipid A export ATP-binding/permease protein MsbA [uncultured Desulfobacterium sp.]|uniref:Putative Lipid A export ATP-binding/permease protein MsbA n=1 Tax=uncultured Desulfobacterium sp. TaxID=201089 RepID=A0A445MS09_9BACT|nr:putative Lipid A export ATP-binding/permease protein MsbA [uncultured Desulfobacterium sp.]